MTKKSGNKLRLGIYRLYWKSGGHSIAAIGNQKNGERWVAPINWIYPDTEGKCWKQILRVELLRYY